MPSKKTWSHRAQSRQPVETVKLKDVWKHAPRMYWAGMLQLIVISSVCSIHAVLAFVFILRLGEEKDPKMPSLWESALPVWAIAMLIAAGFFALSLTISIPGKRRLKRLLLPARCQRCPKCFYDLSARPRGDDTCPECGITAPRRECVRLWCKLLRTRF